MQLAAHTSLIVVVVIIPIILSLLSSTSIHNAHIISPMLAIAAVTPTTRLSEHHNLQNQLTQPPQQIHHNYRDQMQEPPILRIDKSLTPLQPNSPHSLLSATSQEKTTVMMKTTNTNDKLSLTTTSTSQNLAEKLADVRTNSKSGNFKNSLGVASTKNIHDLRDNPLKNIEENSWKGRHSLPQEGNGDSLLGTNDNHNDGNAIDDKPGVDSSNSDRDISPNSTPKVRPSVPKDDDHNSNSQSPDAHSSKNVSIVRTHKSDNGFISSAGSPNKSDPSLSSNRIGLNQAEEHKSVMGETVTKMAEDVNYFNDGNKNSLNSQGSSYHKVDQGYSVGDYERNNAEAGFKNSVLKVKAESTLPINESLSKVVDKNDKSAEEVHGFLFNNMRRSDDDSPSVLSFHQNRNDENVRIDDIDNGNSRNIDYDDDNDEDEEEEWEEEEEEDQEYNDDIGDYSDYEDEEDNEHSNNPTILDRERREVKITMTDAFEGNDSKQGIDNSDSKNKNEKKTKRKKRKRPRDKNKKKDKKAKKNKNKNDPGSVDNKDESNNNNTNKNSVNTGNNNVGSQPGYTRDSNSPSSSVQRHAELHKDASQLEGYWEKTNKAHAATDRRKPAFWSEDIQVGCRELRARRYITDGFCTSEKAIKEVVCAGHCLPIKDMPWYAEFVKTISRTKLRDWQCVEDMVQKKRVRLVCRNAEYRFYRIKVVKSCKCKKITSRHNRTRRNKRKKRRRRKSKKIKVGNDTDS